MCGTEPTKMMIAARPAAWKRSLSTIKLVSAYYSQPKPNSKLGEDALFISPHAVGVADGVGGWKQNNIDSGDYSRTLMKNCQDIVLRQPEVDARALFKQAVTQVGEGIFGTCTVCILTVNLHTCTAQVANLGDSRFVYLRRGDDGKAWGVVGQTKDQTCGFNTPFQIGKYPPGFGTTHEFTSEDADVYDMQHVQKNDLFVLATDGVFDNVFVKEVVAICDRVSSTQEREDKQEFVSQLAKQIGTYSLQCAKKTNGDTPFAQYAKVNNLKFTGGKMDDISVVVSLVC